jgi:hypothetical protein
VLNVPIMNLIFLNIRTDLLIAYKVVSLIHVFEMKLV